MLTGPLFKWFGSKWSISKHYPTPRHKKLFEPFAGSACYSCRYSELKVTIWEENPALIALWSWLIKNAKEQEIRDIPVNLREGFDIRRLGLNYGQELLLKHWQRTNNLSKTWSTSSWGAKPGQWTENTRARVAEESQLVKHWELKPIAYNLIGTYFIDPPYLYNYRYGFHDFDYPRLTGLIMRLPDKAQVIACEAVDKNTGRIPNYLPFKPFRKMITMRRKSPKSFECLYHRLTLQS